MHGTLQPVHNRIHTFVHLCNGRSCSQYMPCSRYVYTLLLPKCQVNHKAAVKHPFCHVSPALVHYSIYTYTYLPQGSHTVVIYTSVIHLLQIQCSMYNCTQSHHTHEHEPSDTDRPIQQSDNKPQRSIINWSSFNLASCLYVYTSLFISIEPPPGS